MKCLADENRDIVTTFGIKKFPSYIYFPEGKKYLNIFKNYKEKYRFLCKEMNQKFLSIYSMKNRKYNKFPLQILNHGLNLFQIYKKII